MFNLFYITNKFNILYRIYIKIIYIDFVFLFITCESLLTETRKMRKVQIIERLNQPSRCQQLLPSVFHAFLSLSGLVSVKKTRFLLKCFRQHARALLRGLRLTLHHSWFLGNAVSPATWYCGLLYGSCSLIKYITAHVYRGR